MKQSGQSFDVIVIGGGHAGTEAALAAARMGATVLLATHRFDRIGEMSCNPAIGGLGKGHLVKEIDALDGAMGITADRAGIQFRLLNRRKGPAVRGPRAQCDRALYRKAIQDIISASPVRVVEGEVSDLLIESGQVRGITLATGDRIASRAVIVTTGTFLRGRIHIGGETSEGGRMGDPASTRLAQRFDDLDLKLGRLKTGTPPRLDGRTIDWTVLERQDGDAEPVLFSSLSKSTTARQIACGITHTNRKTHEIIEANLGRSAMYSGRISGTGPRYCPSIEDKVTRFSDKSAHQIFLEPEGLEDDTIYPNGISTSLPRDVQEQYVRSIQGLEQVRITQPGYAIEYDFVDPRALTSALMVSRCEGLFLAGQINGTTGYEEAAAQGLAAGLNAALFAAEKAPVMFDRAESYIGVMIDDLTRKGVTEPYRMFTSRAEFRLHLRADNADQRLTPLGLSLGCVGADRQARFAEKMAGLTTTRGRMEAVSITPQQAATHGLRINQDGLRRNAVELIGQFGVEAAALKAIWPELSECDEAMIEQIGIESLYRSYLDRQRLEVDALSRDRDILLPEGLDYKGISGLSAELGTKLATRQPRSLADAAEIEGITPSALAILHGHAKRARLSA